MARVRMFFSFQNLIDHCCVELCTSVWQCIVRVIEGLKLVARCLSAKVPTLEAFSSVGNTIVIVKKNCVMRPALCWSCLIFVVVVFCFFVLFFFG